ncbi:MAG TPA: TldD/PmbA family protein [Thermoleophilia bacterium]|nr:TldD/PmbA family protein [Thermoleophilia bacterium]
MQLDDLSRDLLDATIRRALRHGGEFAEVFVEDRRSLGLSLEERRVERAAGGREAGFGVRLTSGDRTYYSYSDDLSEDDLEHAADAVAAALRGETGDGAAVVDLGAVRAARATAPIAVAPESVATEIKAGLLRAADEAARDADPAVSQVMAGYLESRQRVLVANSLGAYVTDDRTRLRFTVQVVARRDDVIQTGYESLGKSLGFEIVDEQIARGIAAAAAGKAVTMLDSRPAPTGPMAVVMGNGFGGTLFHEACGHGLEADGIAKGSSIYEGKIGAVVAAPIVSAYDDGTIAGEWGSAGVDDEGAPTQKTVVIDEGRLRGFLYDGLRARGEGVAQTGNGRRQSFRHVPIPRMTTTCIAPGQASADEIIAATERGFYAKTLAGGQVEPASGNFVFGVAEGYLIEHGRVTTPLRGATLVGNGIDILKSIDMIGSDFEVKSGICGKDGQSVPVGTGQATLRIAAMTVGGTG